MGLCCLIDQIFWPALVVSVCFVGFFCLKLTIRSRKVRRERESPNRRAVAFFHPYCNAGGGGERVLWCAIQALQKKYSSVDCIVYTGDTDAKETDILKKAESRFGVTLDRPVTFVYLNQRRFVEASMYPVFTLLGQSIGGFLLGIEALSKFVPDVYIDSMGYAFTLPLFRYLANCQTVAYVHYPTISTDMLEMVRDRRESYNNSSVVSRNLLLSRLKLIYYRFFAFIYGLAGSCSHLIMVNSTWTYGHIMDLWGRPHRTYIVYPPCDVNSLADVKVESENLLNKEGEVRILSIGQFRPEKDHPLQLKSLSVLKQLIEKEKSQSDVVDKNLDKVKKTKLVLIGGCRDEEDRLRVDKLKEFARENLNLSLEDDVEFLLNVDYDKLKLEFSKALIGIHTMWNEHFGIGVVECMTAGNIMVAHNSGGPKMDILNLHEGHPPGFLASNAEEYAKTMLDIIKMDKTRRDAIRDAAKIAVTRFSTEEFAKRFLDSFELSITL